MKILILSQWCFPEPDLKALTFARALVQKGHSVQILTGFPNYPGGKVYPGYKISLFKQEEIDGITILRCALYPSHDRSGVKRILNYVSFAFFAAIIGIFKVRKAAIMYVYHPPATVAIPALLIKLFRGIPVVYDIQDMWPDTLKATGMLNNPVLLKLVEGYMRFCYRCFDHITVLSNGFKHLLVERGVPASKVSVIYNWSNPVNIPVQKNGYERETLWERHFTVLFAGTIGLAQGLDVVIRCAEKLMERNENNVQFVLLGGGTDVERLKSQAEDKKLTNIRFIGRVPNNEVGRYLVMADVLLIHLVANKLFEITVPSKTQAYLLAGKPILAGVKGDAAALVEEAGAGCSFSPEKEDELLEKILFLKNMDQPALEQLGQQGKAFYDDYLSIEKGVEKFEQLFITISKKNKHAIYANLFKPLMDFLLALSGFIILLPIFIPVMILLFIANSGKVFFLQPRPGKNEKVFRIIKFKTMNDRRDTEGNLLPDHLRLTAIGRFVRKTSLDEIPQLLNVIKGDMSLIGPRPLLADYLPLYNEQQQRRHWVRPGITGWAQVNGRNAISWTQKFEYDIWYVDHLGFALDMKILWRTLFKVARSEGISSANVATMEKFTGN